MKTENVTFAGADGHELAGKLDLPAGPTRAVALFAHCFSCGKDLRSVVQLTSRLTSSGIAVLRFDFTGLGRSEGEFADTNFSSNVADLVVAADWLRQTYAAPTLLIGHSLGGAAAIVAAAKIPELAALVVVGAPADPAHVAHLFEGKLDEIAECGHAAVNIAGRTFNVKQQFVDDVAESNLDAALAGLDVPLLVMHSPQDTIVPFENGDRIFAKANGSKSFVSLDGADHLLTDRRQAEWAADVVTAWSEHHLPERVAAGDDVLVPGVGGEVVVAERGTGRFAQVVRVGDRHAILADEPQPIGDDTGPAPYDLLLAALGTCTSMTVRMYADRKGWPLEDIAVRLTHEKIHAEDCADCESTSAKVDVIERELVLVGPLDDDQRDRLLEIADKCPVHRSLHDETVIRTALEDPPRV